MDISAIAGSVWALLCQMAPYLLLGFVFSSLLHAFVPPSLLQRRLGGGVGSVALATVVGAPLPMCSCSVLPAAMTLRQRGASPGATAAFLTATPITSVDSIFVTYAFFGAAFAAYRVGASLAAAFVVGVVVHLLGRRDAPAPPQTDACSLCGSVEPHRHSLKERLVKGLEHGFLTLPRSIGRWILLGVLVGGVLSALLPVERVRDFGAGWTGPLIMLLVGVPLYVCSTGSVPIGAALVAGGFSTGSALVFLLVGPASNIASLLVLWRSMGRRFVVVTLLSLAAVSLGVAYVLDNFLAERIAPAPAPSGDAGVGRWLHVASALALLVLMLAAHLPLVRRPKPPANESDGPPETPGGHGCCAHAGG